MRLRLVSEGIADDAISSALGGREASSQHVCGTDLNGRTVESVVNDSTVLSGLSAKGYALGEPVRAKTKLPGSTTRIVYVPVFRKNDAKAGNPVFLIYQTGTVDELHDLHVVEVVNSFAHFLDLCSAEV